MANKLENDYKTQLIKKIKNELPGSIITHMDPTEINGIPDLVIFNGNKYAMLEGKRFGKAAKRPLQDYYVDKINEMAFASFIYPENENEVLERMYDYFRKE